MNNQVVGREAILASVSEGKVLNFNEAQTRHRIIDPIIFGILGWNHDEVTVEERLDEDGNTSYIDYFFRTAQISLLVEAKRINSLFSFSTANRRMPLKGSWLKGPVGNAVVQARDYGRSRSVGFCAATNGDAWVIFPINRTDGVTFEDSHALVFQDAKSALNYDFDEFSDALSRDSVIDGSLERLLLGGENNQTDTRRLNQIYDQSFSSLSRTPLFKHIEAEIATAFSDELLADNPETLSKVYVTTSERTRFDERIGMTVRRRDQVLKHAPIKPLSAGGLSKASTRIESIKVATRPAIILTLGLVGAGKTTFLNHLRNVSAANYFSDERDGKAIWVQCDFKDFSQFQSPREYLLDRVLEYATFSSRLNSYEHFVSKAYARDVEAMKRGPLSLIAKNKDAVSQAIYAKISDDMRDKSPYVEKVFSHASALTPVFIVIDNVDQITDPQIQESIFLESLSFARRVGANLILSMRDYTYVKNRNSPVFDAFDIDAIYIDAPPVPAVLAARFRFAEQLVSGQSVDDFTSRGHRVHIDDAATIVSLLRGSVLGTEVGRVIELASAGDIRLALRMTRNFLQYGYASSVEKYMRFRSQDRITFATHEAIRAIMLGNSVIYRDDLSSFVNPFDAKLGRSESQFLRIYVISAFVNLASDSGFSGLEAVDIIRNLEKLGFSERITTQVINDLIDARVIFTQSQQPYSRDAILVPNRLAGYIVRDLLYTFVYLETTLYDTFIYDDAAWTTIREAFKNIYAERNALNRLRYRKVAVQAFYDFCAEGFARLSLQAQNVGLSPAWQVNPLERGRATFNENLTRVMRSGKRSQSKDQADLTETPRML
ncbi:hypothetical protein HNP47_001875 [Brevundimonas vesicularis]|uniref:Orc1-like AAA ATPase domain-containing protein n=1 Tax=Brevundimonas vesicularis TaxID=41276 RepID=A0A7W9FUR9_BREVE|nr:hypothetical protein [Brevundimonas vesicularis]MBB5771871.1 hypothetical protein [Brevundimonas vesicularis]